MQNWSISKWKLSVMFGMTSPTLVGWERGNQLHLHLTWLPTNSVNRNSLHRISFPAVSFCLYRVAWQTSKDNERQTPLWNQIALKCLLAIPTIPWNRYPAIIYSFQKFSHFCGLFIFSFSDTTMSYRGGSW